MIEIKRVNKRDEFHDRKMESLIATFIDKKRELDELNKKLNAIKEDIIEFAREQKGSDKSIQMLIKNKGVKVTFSDEFKVVDVDKLRGLLGEEFKAFVKVEYKAKSGLRALYLNNKKVSGCLKLNEKKPTVALVVE